MTTPTRVLFVCTHYSARVRTRVHWSFPDPSRASGTHDERLAVFRRVRDQIEARLAEWLREPGPA